MVEHYVRDVGAAGSNPVTSTSAASAQLDAFESLPFRKAFFFAEWYIVPHDACKQSVMAIDSLETENCVIFFVTP